MTSPGADAEPGLPAPPRPLASPAEPDAAAPAPGGAGRTTRALARFARWRLARTQAEGRMLLRGAGRLLGVAPRRARLVERRGTQAGLPPGTLREQPDAKPAVIEVFRYSAEGFEEREHVTADEAAALAHSPGVTWINVDGHRDAAAIRRIGEAFGLHPLVQEDLSTAHQRPKLEPYGDHQLFVVVKMANPGARPVEEDSAGGLCDHEIEQVAFVLGPDYLLSFQEDAVGDVFDPVRDRIRSAASRIRTLGPDYLLYALLDVIVDRYFITLERIGDATERLEVEVFEQPTPALLGAVQALRREVVVLRRVIWPLREVLAALLRDETALISERTRLYLRDVYDHQIQAVDTVETIRDVLDGLVDHYLSAVSYRTNEVMRVLTVVGTIFLPLTLITSCYGMNFDHMPELHTRYGYFVVLGMMLAVTVGILAYFRRRGWV